MKVKMSVFLFIILFFSLLISLDCGFAEEKDKEAKITLSWSIAWPPSDVLNAKVAPWFADEIYERTDGMVKIELYHGGELLGARETYQGIVEGVADIGTSRFAFTPGRFPVSLAFEMPGLYFNNNFAADHAYNDFYNKYKPEELQDTHLLWINGTGPCHVLSRVPIRTLEDFRGLKIRVDALALDAARELGGRPTSMPIGDVYLALDRGVVDANIGRFGNLVTFGQAEIINYITTARFIQPNVAIFNTMNLETWESLPSDVQRVFNEVSREAIDKMAEGYFEFENKALKAAKENKIEMIHLSSEQEDKWISRLEPIQEQWVTDMEEKGIPGKEMLKDLKQFTKKYNEKYPEQWPSAYYELYD